jgi:hypothetical protein
MAFEGILLAERDLNYLAGCYGVNTAAMLLALGALSRGGVGIAGVWGGLVAFQVVRLVQFGVRLFRRHVLGRRRAVAETDLGGSS